MIKSMTGYGKAEKELARKKITIEVKSLNSKQLDINTRIPGLYKSKDLEIRKKISEILFRGKVELFLFYDNLGENPSASINVPIVKGYYEQIVQLQSELNISEPNLLQTLLQLPDSMKTEYEELDEDEWSGISELVKEALSDLDQFRCDEGVSLRSDITSQIKTIQDLLPQVEQFESERIETVKERVMDNLKEFDVNEKLDKNRFEQELIYYMEKFDINEEKVRLSNHLTYFLETMDMDGANGKKLGFIAQEIGREVNTLGSKANHAEIQKIVIRMKDALERIKEQVLNVL